MPFLFRILISIIQLNLEWCHVVDWTIHHKERSHSRPAPLAHWSPTPVMMAMNWRRH